MAWVKNNWILKWIAAGLLLGSGFLYAPLWILGLLGAAYFLYLLNESISLKQACLGAWVAWTIKAGCAVWWFWSVYPIEWLNVELGIMQLPVIFLYWFPVSLWLGTGGIAVAWLWWQLRSIRLQHWVQYFVAWPLVWVVGEIIGSLVFSLMLIGPGGGPNVSFSFGYGGYHLAQHPWLLQLAQIGGVYILSFVFTLAAGLMYLATKQEKRIQHTVAVAVVVLFMTGILSDTPDRLLEENRDMHSVAIIDTDFAIRHGLTPLEKLLIAKQKDEAIAAALKQQTDYILWPEDTRYFNQERPAVEVQTAFQIKYNNPEVIVLDSGTIRQNDGGVLQTFVYTGPDQSIEQVQKRYLVPQGEYVPYFYSGLLRLFGFGEAIEKISQNVAYIVGDQVDQGELSSEVPGILFCFESVAPQGVKTILKERPEIPFVAHPISHAWFHEPKTLWSQQDAMLKVQAVWSGQYIVSVANKANGKLYTPKGKIIEPTTVESGENWEVRLVQIPKR